MNEALNIVRNKAEKTVWDKRDGSERILDKSDICPISGKWLIPANCTEVEPTEEKDNESSLVFNGKKWIKEKKTTHNEDYKEQEYIKSSQEQIQELKDEIEQLKFEKKEILLNINLEKENLLDEIENTREELKNIRKEIENAREEIIELSNSISEAREELILLKEAAENGFEADSGNRSF